MNGQFVACAFGNAVERLESPKFWSYLRCEKVEID
jgi:hypothetical protein